MNDPGNNFMTAMKTELTPEDNQHIAVKKQIQQ